MGWSVLLLGTNWELGEQNENIINNHRALGERVIWNPFGNTKFLKNPNPPPLPPQILQMEKNWASWVHLGSCHPWLGRISIWPINCGDVLNLSIKSGKQQHQKHVFAQFIRHKRRYNTTEKQRVLIGVKLFFCHQLGMKLVSWWIGLSPHAKTQVHMWGLFKALPFFSIVFSAYKHIIKCKRNGGGEWSAWRVKGFSVKKS
jgi:hypothetical protein